MALKESHGWQITCDGRACRDATAFHDRVMSAVAEAQGRDWCRLGAEWFCPSCAWDLEIGLGDQAGPVRVAELHVFVGKWAEKLPLFEGAE